MPMSKCCHDLNKEGNTLQILSRRMLVYPPQLDCMCTICHKAFKFRKDESDNKYHKILKRAPKNTTKEQED